MKTLNKKLLCIVIGLLLYTNAFAATIISSATGNFTTSATWQVANSAAELDSETSNTATTTSYVASSVFAPGVITIDAIAVKIQLRSASPTGTFSVELYNSTLGASVANTETTINVSDLNLNAGWYVFPTNGDVLLLAATNYAVRVKSSTNGQVAVYRNATSNNWSRQLRTTTTGAPAAGDKMIVAGEHTGAGTGNDFTVTMQNTATTIFGAVAFPQSLSVSKRGTLTFGTTAATAYVLRVAGIIGMFEGGTINAGTSGTRMPSSSTAEIYFEQAADTDSGIEVYAGGTFNAYGATKTNLAVTLDSDEAASQTIINNLSSTTDWVLGNLIAFSPTATSASQGEKKIISTVDSANQITLTAGLTNAHSGTSPTKSRVILLSRNVKIHGESTSQNGFIRAAATAALNFSFVEVYNMGSTSTNKRGIENQTTTGSFIIDSSAIYDFTGTFGVGMYNNTTTGGLTFTNNVMYNFSCAGVIVNATTAVPTVTGNTIIGIGSTCSGGGIDLSDVGGIVTGNFVSGAQASTAGYTLSEAGGKIGTFSDNTANTNSASGLRISNSVTGTVTNFTGWRNTTTNVSLTSGQDIIFEGLNLFGGVSSNMDLNSGLGEIQINNSTFNGGTVTIAPVGIRFQGSVSNLKINSTTFGATTTHSTADLQVVSSGAAVYAELNNVGLSSTELSNQSSLTPSSYIGSSKHDQTVGSHKTFRKYGTITIDTAISDVSPSSRMTPTSASGKLESLVFRVPVSSGSAATVNVKVRESVVGDGTDYNGNRIRLIVKKNVSLGITSDTVLATATISSEGAFQTLTGTTASPTDDGVLDILVDCDGTTGWVNVDTFSATPPTDSKGFKFWQSGAPVVNGDNGSSSGAGGSFVFVGN